MQSQTYSHVCAYFASIANGLTNADLAAVSDGILTRVNSHFVVPQEAQLLAAFGSATNLSRGRLNTPKFRYVGLPSLIPINVTLAVPSPPNVVDFTDYPLSIDKVDEIAVEVTHSDAGAQNVLFALWLGFGVKNVTPAPVYRVRGTASITNSAGTWVNGSITMDQTLPQGRYQVVGMDCVGTNLALARLIFPGASFRPGVLCRNSVGQYPHPVFRDKKLGVLGEFESINLPNLETLSIGANTSQEVFLDIIRLGSSN